MNRKEKRALIKKLKTKGFSETNIENAILVKEMQTSKKFLKEGQKVKLNLLHMMKHPDFNRLMESRKNWVKAHENNYFTVKYDKKYKNNPVLVCLEEDETNPKWLFHESDLEVIGDFL